MWWITVALILAGIVFMLVEMLLVPGVGIAGFFSVGAFTASCWYTFNYISNCAGWWVTSVVLIILIIMVVIILRAKTWKRFELQTEIHSKVNKELEQIHIGDKGIAHTRLAPRGTGLFGNISCEVKSHDNSMIAASTPIEVVAIIDNQVIIKPIE